MVVKIKIYTLGCKVNQYDSGKLASELVQAGFMMAGKNADITIINSCAVTKTAMIKSGRMIKLAKKENPKAKIVLVGCWPKAGEIRKNMAGVDLAVKTGDYKNLIKLICKQYRKQSEIASPVNARLAMTDKGRYFIKIQDGCEQYCSYCIIPYTRGKLKSRAEKEIICEIEQAVKAGYLEIVLSGIHLGLYRSVMPDLIRRPERMAAKINLDSRLRGNDSTNLAGLLKKIIKINGLGRARLSSIEATEVSDKLISLMAESKKICKHLHIPLQSGSDKILKLMNRPYDAEYFQNKIKQIRQAMPDIAITTDVIVGFPGETEKDFRDTEKFIKQIKFSRLHVFPFSAHGKTPAAKFPGQVEEKTKARRAKILRQLSVKLAEDYKKKFKGREMEIVVEQIKQGKMIGKTEYYFEVEVTRKKIKNKNLKVGEIVKVRY